MAKKKKTIEELDADIEALFKQQNTIGKAIRRTRKQRGALFAASIRAKMPKKLTPKFVMSLPWDAIANGISDETTKIWAEVTEWLNEQPGMRHYGYNSETNQVAVQICLDQKIPLNKQLGILRFIPHIKTFKKNKKDIIYIGVFEHTLSEYGVYEIQRHGETWQLIKTTYHHPNICCETTNISELLKYIYKHHPYERLTTPEDDD